MQPKGEAPPARRVEGTLRNDSTNGDAGTALVLLPAQRRLTPPGKVLNLELPHIVFWRRANRFGACSCPNSFHSAAELVQLILYFLILGTIGLATRAVETNSRPPVVSTDPRQSGQAPGRCIGIWVFPALRFGPDY